MAFFCSDVGEIRAQLPSAEVITRPSSLCRQVVDTTVIEDKRDEKDRRLSCRSRCEGADSRFAAAMLRESNCPGRILIPRAICGRSSRRRPRRPGGRSGGPPSFIMKTDARGWSHAAPAEAGAVWRRRQVRSAGPSRLPPLQSSLRATPRSRQRRRARSANIRGSAARRRLRR